MRQFGELLVRRRGWAGGLVCLLTLLAVIGVARLDFEDRARDLYRRRDEETRLLDRILENFGADDNDMLLVLEAPEVFAPEVLRRVEDLVARLKRIDGVAEVHSVFDVRRQRLPIPLVPPRDSAPERFAHARELAAEHPLVRRRLISEDFRTMLLVVPLEGQALSAAHLKEMDTRVRREAREAAGGAFTFRLTGQPAVRVDSLHTLKVEQLRFTLLSGALSFVIACLLFRRLGAVLLAVTAPAVGVLWCIGAISLAGQKVDGINIVLPTLLFVIGFTDVTHLLVDIRRQLAAGATPRRAAAVTVGRLGWACLLTSLTTAIGFGSLVISDTGSVQRFGLWCAAGAGLMFLAAIVLTPLLASLLPAAWLAPPARAADAASLRRTLPAAILAPLLRFPRLLVVLGVVLSLAFAWTARRLESDIRWTEALPAHGETNSAVEHLDRHFGGAVHASALLTWPEGRELSDPEVLEQLAAVHRVLAAEELLGEPFSVLDLLGAMRYVRGGWSGRVAQLEQLPPAATRRLLRADLRQALVTVPVPNRGERVLQPVYRRVAARLAELEAEAPGFRLQLTGTTVVAGRNIDHMIADLQMSLFGAAAVVFVVMLLAFRSWRLGFMTLLPNSFPLLFTSALMVWLGEPLRITGALTYCLCLGLAVDDTIHLLARYLRERAAGGENREVVLRAVDSVGSVLAITTLILGGGLGVMAFSQMPAISAFASLSLVALAMALVGDLVFLPALLLAFPPRSHAGDQPPREPAQRADA